MTKPTPTPLLQPKPGQSREEFIQELKQQYADGRLDSLLLPEGIEIPEQLLKDLFPPRKKRH